MGTTNILDLNNRVDDLEKSYPANKVMMSDGVTSVEDAVDEVTPRTVTVQIPSTAGSVSDGVALPSGYTQSNCIIDQCYADVYNRRYLGDILISEKITIFMTEGYLYISTDSTTSSSWLGVNVVVILRKL